MLRGWLNQIRRDPEAVLDHLIEVTKELAIDSTLDGLTQVEVQCALRHLRAARVTEQKNGR